MNNLHAKLKAAWRSLTVWVLTAGLLVTESLPYVLESLPMAREVLDEQTYQLVVRVVLVLGIILRVRTVTAPAPAAQEGANG